MLSALLWLCAEEPDISNITGEPIIRSELQAPKHTVHPKTKNFITPSMPTVYNIGKRLGGEIRQMNDAIERDKAIKEKQRKTPSHPSWSLVWLLARHGSGEGIFCQVATRCVC